MPMYFPDLKSIQDCVNSMRRNKGMKQYTGIYPKTEKELPEARRQLGIYFRKVWHDEMQAIEVEEATTEENYNKIMRDYVAKIFHSTLP